MKISELLSLSSIRRKVGDDTRGPSSYSNSELEISKTNSSSPVSYSGIIKVITDEPASRSPEDALHFDTYSMKLAEIIKNSTPKFAVGIFGGWGTGKTTLMRMIEKKLENNDDILIVWFDPWKYENEKYLAAIPFIRTIQIEVENKLIKLLKDRRPKDRGISSRNAERWNEMRKGLLKALNAFIESANLNLAMGGYGSVGVDLAKFKDVLKSNGQPIQINNESIYYHHIHIADYLVEALTKLRKSKIDSGRDPRIVVFIDDLDRCAPEKALEVLESLKTFFDVEGFVYVIGMNSESINSIIKKKYGEDFGKGLEYMQKIVQLPFQIPTWKGGWKEDEIFDSIKKVISKDLQGSDLMTKFEADRLKKLIVKGVPLNPRQVKRFINNIILTQAVFNKDIDKLIAVQALSFRETWQKFLKFITPSSVRDDFFSGYDELKNDLKRITTEEDLINYRKRKVGDDPNLSQKYESCYTVFLELFKSDKDGARDLLGFLEAGADNILKDIKEMEDYLIALTSVKGPEENIASQVAEQSAADEGGLIQSSDRLSGTTVSHIIAKNPETLGFLKFKLTDKVEKIVKAAKDMNFKIVMITDESGLKVFGLLFISDLLKIKSEGDLLVNEDSLQAFIETNEVTDDITKMRWTKQGVSNFVTANMYDSVKNVVDKMKGLSDSLSVRAVVTENGAPKAILAYDTIINEFQK